MNREQHYREAEKRLTASDWQRQEGSMKAAMHEVAMAHVHALLANVSIEPSAESPLGSIEQERAARGWTIDVAAARAGIAPKTWQRLEDGLPVRSLTFAKVDDLFGWAPGTAVGTYLTPAKPARADQVDADAYGSMTLGQAVLDRRTELLLSQEQVAELGGPAVASLRTIEGDKAEVYRPKTLRSLDIALDWEAGTAQRILTASTETGGAA